MWDLIVSVSDHCLSFYSLLNPVIRDRITNMWPLLNNSREFSVIKRKNKIHSSSEKGNLLFKKKKEEHTEKSINYDISSTLFRVCFAILCSSIDRYQIDQQARPGAWP